MVKWISNGQLDMQEKKIVSWAVSGNSKWKDEKSEVIEIKWWSKSSIILNVARCAKTTFISFRIKDVTFETQALPSYMGCKGCILDVLFGCSLNAKS